MLNVLNQLTNVINDPNRFFSGSNIPDQYRYDEYVTNTKDPLAVAIAKSKEEVVALVKVAAEHKLSIITVGAQTGLSGATAPMGGELMIDLHTMNRIIELDRDTMTLTVEPGVLVGEVHEYVEKLGFFYPPDPGSKHSSIGGNVATNAGGMRAVKYGVTRDYVRSIEVVLVDGRTITLGSLNIKSSSGYDLKDLFIGSEGTLGIITRVTLRLLPLPKVNLTVAVAFESVTDAAAAVLTINRNGVAPTAMEFFEKEAIELSEKENDLPFPSQAGKAYLLLTLDADSSASLEQRLIHLEESVNQHHAVEFRPLTDPAEEHTAWFLRDRLLTSVVNYTEQVTMDEVVPIDQFVTLYQFTKELEQESGLTLISFGHAGDGNLHTCITRGNIADQAEWEAKRDDVLKKLYQKINDLGGLPSAEHGIGVIKKPYFHKMTDPILLELMRTIKQGFDPEGRLNPHKVL